MLDRYRFIYVRWLVRWTPVFVLLLAAFWRFDGITNQSFWNDEGNTLSLIRRDVPDLLEQVKPDIHPPGYYIMLKGWTALAGEHEMGLRSYSAFLGIIAVAFTYALGARLYSRAAGIIAALLVAMNSLAVYYSQEARMYAQLAALTIISLYLLAVLVQTLPRSKRFFMLAAALAIVNTLGLYSHYTYPFTMIVQGIFFVWWIITPHPEKQNQRESLLIYIGANLITLVLFLPWLPTAYDQITTWPTFDSGVALSEKITTVLTYITFGNSASDSGWMDFLWIGVIFFAILLPDWYHHPPPNNWRVGLPLVWMLIICGALFYSGAYREANLKFLLPAQIAMALILGRGIYL
ncbi:MAG TPA: glycosyltransferase family 39 protein, partial [Aggregatilineales bacterium]|nr:glycosyltransferase family 39 protein [Aggregatilineales bacterium]